MNNRLYGQLSGLIIRSGRWQQSSFLAVLPRAVSVQLCCCWHSFELTLTQRDSLPWRPGRYHRWTDLANEKQKNKHHVKKSARYEVKWVTGVVSTWTPETQSGLRDLSDKACLKQWALRVYACATHTIKSYSDHILCVFQTPTRCCAMAPLSNIVWASLMSHAPYDVTPWGGFLEALERKMRWWAADYLEQ